MMRKQYSAAFKARVVQELLKEEKTLAQIASEYEVHPTQLKNWRAIALEGLPGLFKKQKSTTELKRAHEQELSELYAELGKLSTQVAWLKKTAEWQTSIETRQKQGVALAPSERASPEVCHSAFLLNGNLVLKCAHLRGTQG